MECTNLSLRLPYIIKQVSNSLLLIIVQFAEHVCTIKNGGNLLSENRVVFYFRNDDVMYYLRWRRSSARRDIFLVVFINSVQYQIFLSMLEA